MARAFGTGKLSRDERHYDIRCPICAPMDPKKRKLSIRVEDEANHCWTCGWGSRSIAPLVRKYCDRSVFEEYKRLFGVVERKRDDTVTEQPTGIVLPPDYKLLALSARSRDPNVRDVYKYAVSRGITDDIMWRYKLGASDEYRWRRRVIVPSFDATGELNYMTARAIDDNRYPRYDNLDVKRNEVVFNELMIDWTREVILCEGPFDMLKCGDNSLPLLGSSLSPESLTFDRLIVNETPVVVSLDNDKVPESHHLARTLTEYKLRVKVLDLGEWKDPGSMDPSQFRQLLAFAKEFNWQDTTRMKLRRAVRVSMGI